MIWIIESPVASRLSPPPGRRARTIRSALPVAGARLDAPAAGAERAEACRLAAAPGARHARGGIGPGPPGGSTQRRASSPPMRQRSTSLSATVRPLRALRGASSTSRRAHDGVRTSAVAVWPSALVAVKVRTRRSQRHLATRRRSVERRGRGELRDRQASLGDRDLHAGGGAQAAARSSPVSRVSAVRVSGCCCACAPRSPASPMKRVRRSAALSARTLT